MAESTPIVEELDIIVPSVQGNPYNRKFIGLTQPGVDKKLIEEIAPAGKKLWVLQVYIICRQSGKINMLKDVEDIGSGRTGPGASNFFFRWSPYQIIDEGEKITISFLEMIGKPIVDLEAYMHARILDVV